MPHEFGRLESVELRDVWKNEAADFTPWLASEESLSQLGEILGIELELEATEKNVGPFRADILCKNTLTDEWVLIENQLARTDHSHLGQILTYAAGLEAATIVWIAQRFTEEHRAALDWLNDITDDRVDLFGLQVEAWRIASSPIAPKFNVVCRPNDFRRATADAARVVSKGELTETRQWQYEYWTQFTQMLAERKTDVRPQRPRPKSWIGFPLGRSGFGMSAAVNSQKGWIMVGVSCSGPDADTHFSLLRDDCEAIEREMDAKLAWEELPNKKESRIALRRDVGDPSDRTTWTDQHEWLCEQIDKLHRVFAPRVKVLDASEARTDLV